MSKNMLFVGNLPSSLSGFSLNALFAPFGKIVNVDVISESRTGRSKRFGFVTFSESADARKAMTAMNNKDIEGLNIVVKMVNEEEELELISSHHEQAPSYTS